MANNLRILIETEDRELCRALERDLSARGFETATGQNRASLHPRLERYGLVITDAPAPAARFAYDSREDAVNCSRVFNIDAANALANGCEVAEVRGAVEETLACKARLDDSALHESGCESFRFHLPSDPSLVASLAHYLSERAGRRWPNPSDEVGTLYVALDEALVNAVKHGNRNDPGRLFHVSAEVSPRQARFVVEDEGEGFNPETLPHPRDPEQLLKSSGRGVLMIRSLMDAVEYNERGNRLTMIRFGPGRSGGG